MTLSKKTRANRAVGFDLWSATIIALKVVFSERKAFFKCSVIPLISLLLIIATYILVLYLSGRYYAIGDQFSQVLNIIGNPGTALLNLMSSEFVLSVLLLLLLFPFLLFTMNWQAYILFETYSGRAMHRRLYAQKINNSSRASAKGSFITWVKTFCAYALKSIMICGTFYLVVWCFMYLFANLDVTAHFIRLCVYALGIITFPYLLVCLSRVSFAFPALLNGQNGNFSQAFAETHRFRWQLFAAIFFVFHVGLYVMFAIFPIVIGVLEYILPTVIFQYLIPVLFLYLFFAFLAVLSALPAVSYMQENKKFQLRLLLLRDP